MSMEPTGERDSDAYSKKMVQAKDELSQLQAELNNVLVKFVYAHFAFFNQQDPNHLDPAKLR
jgi:hypothetical protein